MIYKKTRPSANKGATQQTLFTLTPPVQKSSADLCVRCKAPDFIAMAQEVRP